MRLIWGSVSEPCPECGHDVGAQEHSTRTMVAAMESSLGPLSPERRSQAEMVIGLAQAVDANTDRGALWREFRIADAAFRNVKVDSGDEFDRLAAALSADLGNA